MERVWKSSISSFYSGTEAHCHAVYPHKVYNTRLFFSKKKLESELFTIVSFRGSCLLLSCPLYSARVALEKKQDYPTFGTTTLLLSSARFLIFMNINYAQTPESSKEPPRSKSETSQPNCTRVSGSRSTYQTLALAIVEQTHRSLHLFSSLSLSLSPQPYAPHSPNPGPACRRAFLRLRPASQDTTAPPVHVSQL